MPEVKRCVLCKRPKQRAIREQGNHKQPCPDFNCPFRSEILTKIQEARQSQIKIIKKVSTTIRIIKK
jgi:hypothetical protein